MISLAKLQKPQILVDNAEKWTKEYLDYIEKQVPIPDSVKYRYKNEEIKRQLLKETYGKCAYCESKLNHITSGDIEHILPKNPNARPELYVEWENLTLACEKCNRSGKKDYYNEAEPLLNPYKDDINNELVSVGAFIFPRHGSRRANISIDVLKLNRPELLERRGEAVKRIEELIDRYYNEKNTYYKDIILNEINEEIAEDKEYSFVLKGVFEAMK